MHPAGFVPETIDEDPETFHHRPVEVSARALWVPRLTAQRVLVLGSAQSDADLDRAELARSNTSVARRRSGGGAVLVSDDDLVWFDVVLPHTDPLWTNDVSASFDWLGSALSNAMASLGVETVPHRGPMVRNDWSRRVCFAGLSPGELTSNARKVVGISQRRTREWARFQVAVLRRWDGAEHRRFFQVAENDSRDADLLLDGAAAPVRHPRSDIVEAVVEALRAF